MRSVLENTTLSKTGLFWNLVSWALFSLHAREVIREHTTNTITSITSFPFSCGFSLCFLLPLLVTPKSSTEVTNRRISNFNVGDLSLFVLHIVCVSAVACTTLKALENIVYRICFFLTVKWLCTIIIYCGFMSKSSIYRNYTFRRKTIRRWYLQTVAAYRKLPLSTLYLDEILVSRFCPPPLANEFCKWLNR